MGTHCSRIVTTKIPKQWGTAASTFVYFTQLWPSGGAFFGLNGRAKISSKETSRGHYVCEVNK